MHITVMATVQSLRGNRTVSRPAGGHPGPTHPLLQGSLKQESETEAASPPGLSSELRSQHFCYSLWAKGSYETLWVQEEEEK